MITEEPNANDLLKFVFKEYAQKAIEEKYEISYIPKKSGTKRIIEAPKEERKTLQKHIELYLQKNIKRPVYCHCGWKGCNNITNAKVHVGKRFFVTLDITNFFPSTKSWQVREYLKKLGCDAETENLIVNLTTYKQHLPTGASTSSILATMAHKELFDRIYEYLTSLDITFTLYADDMTLSSNKPISQSCINYIQDVLSEHHLVLKASKIKRFGYKGAVITGVITKQDGTLEMPYKKSLEIVTMLKAKDISCMTLEEIQKLLGKMGYYRQLHPKKFKASRHKALARFVELMGGSNNA